MFCKYCGNEVTGKFCTKCGKSTEEPAVQTAPVQSAPVQTEQPTKKKKKNISGAVIAIISVICTLAIVAGGFCIYKIISDKGDSKGGKETTSSSETAKDEKKKNTKKTDDKKYAFDLSELEDEELKKMAKAGILKKHVDYMSPDEVKDIYDAILNADYRETTAEEIVKFTGRYSEKMFEAQGMEYDEEERIAELQNMFDEEGAFYIAERNGCIIILENEDYKSLDEGIEDATFINTKTDTLYNIYQQSCDGGHDDDFLVFGEYCFEEEFFYQFATYTYKSDGSAACGFARTMDYTGAAVYDENGDLLLASAGDSCYDGKLNSISKDEYSEIQEELEHRTYID